MVNTVFALVEDDCCGAVRYFTNLEKALDDLHTRARVENARPRDHWNQLFRMKFMPFIQEYVEDERVGEMMPCKLWRVKRRHDTPEREYYVKAITASMDPDVEDGIE